MRIKKGFTLSETMIAMGIVGVIVAITVPMVVNHFQKQTKVLMLEKTYKELSDKLELFKNERPYNSIPTFTKAEIYSFLYNEFKRKNTTDVFSIFTKGFASSYKSLNGTTGSYAQEVGRFKLFWGITTKSGSSLYIVPTEEEIEYESECTDSRVSSCSIKPKNDIKSVKLADVYLDVNGKKGPNIGGRDMFKMGIYGDYTVRPVAIVEADDEGKVKDNLTICRESPLGDGCFALILNDDWKMNY